MSEIYILPVSEAARLPEGYGEAHFPKRMERSRGFVQRDDALRCIAAGALVYSVLGAEESEIRTEAWGKPYIPASDKRFCLSHSGAYAILAVSSGSIGADIERIDPRHLRLSDTVFTAEECEWMKAESEKRFYMLWTMKESILKLDGRGLHIDPKTVSVLPLLTAGAMDYGILQLHGQCFAVGDCVLSVCTEKDEAANLRFLDAEALTAMRG